MECPNFYYGIVNTLRPRQNGRHFTDDTFNRIFVNENARISIKISLKFVPKGLNNNISALVQIMAWRRPGDRPLSEPMMVNLPTHICVTRSQWVKSSLQWTSNYTPFNWTIQQNVLIIHTSLHWIKNITNITVNFVSIINTTIKS